MRNLTKTLFTILASVTLIGSAAADDKAKKAPEGKKAPEAKAETAMGPAPELLAAAKAAKGTSTCKGDMTMPDGTTYKSTATVKTKLDLDKMWIKSDFAEKKSKANPHPFKFTSYRTYDAVAKQWVDVMVTNMGGVGTGTSSGPDATGKVTFEVEATGGGMTVKGRNFEEPGTKKKSLHVWGEYSMDGGKTYNKSYDMLCTK